MGADVSDPLVVPAWWIDPQSPKFRRDILVGLLMVDDERFVFATPSGVKFNAPRSEARLEWRRGKGFGMIPRIDLSTPQGWRCDSASMAVTSRQHNRPPGAVGVRHRCCLGDNGSEFRVGRV